MEPSTPKPKHSVLFICLGNICRSCTAEEIFRTLADRQGKSAEVVADSAGLIDYHEGELPDSRMRAHAAHHGYHLTHRSRPVRHEDFSKFDLIVAMDERNREKLLRIAQTDEERRKVVMMTSFLQHHSGHAIVPDPYYGGDKDFELVIELLEDACQGLLDHLTQG